MCCYSHLTQDERYQIFFLRESGFSDRGIGREFDRSNSTISRELKRESNPSKLSPNRGPKDCR